MKNIQEWKAIYSADDSVPFYDNEYLIKIIQQDALAEGIEKAEQILKDDANEVEAIRQDAFAEGIEAAADMCETEQDRCYKDDDTCHQSDAYEIRALLPPKEATEIDT